MFVEFRILAINLPRKGDELLAFFFILYLPDLYSHNRTHCIVEEINKTGTETRETASAWACIVWLFFRKVVQKRVANFFTGQPSA